MERTGGDTQRGRLSPSSRYEVLVRIAAGGMATVYVGRLGGAHGFSRLVAIKRAHAHLLLDRSFRRMLISEARLAARIHHPNVVSVVDVEELEGELLLVMDYVEGASLSELNQAAAAARTPMPAAVALRIAIDACNGLHAAHELCDESGQPLKLVHRDVSPQNILVGADGLARIADFGIAKSAKLSSTANTLTEAGALKGKLAYMAPEYVQGQTIDARADVFAMGVVVWEALTRQRLFRGPNEAETLGRVVRLEAPPVSSVAPGLGADLDAAVAMALVKAPEARFSTAGALAQALEIAAQRAGQLASHADVARFVKRLVGASLEERRARVRDRIAPQPEAEPTADEHKTAALDPDLLPTRAMPAQKAQAPLVEPGPGEAEVAAEASTLGGSNSHATVTPEPAAPPAGRGWLRPLVAGVVVAGAALAAIGVARRGAVTDGAPAATAPVAAVAETRAVVSPESPAALPAPATAAAPAAAAGDPGPQPAVSAVATASASAHDLVPPPRATAPAPPPVAATGPAPRSTTSSRPAPRPPSPSTATAEPVGPRIGDNPY